jgi:GNAT superfamily N-acetyltransferase
MTNTARNFAVRQAMIDDWEKIADFVARTYGAGAPFKHRARWDWQFINTPYTAETGGSAPVWIALDGDKVIGQIALQPGLLWLGDAPLPVGWIVDVMVDEHYRGLGLSHLILGAMAATGRTLVTLTMAAATRRMMEKAHCITLPPVQQLVRPGQLSGQTVATLLDRIAQNRSAWRKPISLFNRSFVGPATAAAAMSASAAISRLSQGAASELKLYDVAAPSAAGLEHLSAKVLGGKRACFDRSPEFAAWRFANAPDLQYKYAELPGDSAARSLLVWREPLPLELPVGTIADIWADPDDAPAITASIEHAIGTMRGRCEAIIAGASDPRFVRAYTAQGFVKVKTHLPTVVSNDAALLDRLSQFGGTWHMTKADHDWDQVHPARD